jgi:predicted DCC family thiol-disulfide oxidoreductase YuxK
MNTPYAVLYDGRCRLCRSQAELIARWDREQRLDILDLNDPQVARHFPQVRPEAAREALHVVGPQGQVYRGAEAVREVVLQVPRLKPLGALLSLPGALSLANPVYDWLARNRYALFGSTSSPTCDDEACR